MINIINKSHCTGCGACISSCPKNIIRMVEDKDGFCYPIVDVVKCINCNRCEKVCPMMIEPKEQPSLQYPYFLAGQLRDKDDLLKVSSGGAFWALAQTVISSGGVVYGAAQFSVDDIRHIRVDNIEDAMKIRRSKYLQSNTGHIYEMVREDLKAGRIVLFSGTGCQTAAVRSFIDEKKSDYLYTCDVVCHGVPSNKVWRKYREEKETKEKKRIIDLVFRDKGHGWSNNHYRIEYDDGSVETERSTQQLFHAGYLAGLFYRPSCGNCQFATIPRSSDITLADFWLYSGNFHSEKNDTGVSLISINSEKGKKLIEDSVCFLETETVEKELAFKSCRHLHEHPSENPLRTLFFRDFHKYGYCQVAPKYIQLTYHSPITTKIRNLIKRIINKI